MPGSVTIHLCGSPALEVDGRRREGDLPGRLGVALLAFLVINRHRPVTRDEMVAALWSDPPPRPYASLRALISKLRGVIGPQFVSGRDPIRTVLPTGTTVDVETAREALHRAEAAIARGDAPSAWGPARVCLLTARRGLLVGLTAPWIDAERDALATVERRALRCVAQVGVALGGAELAAGENAARRLVAEAPHDEEGHRLLMSAMCARGEVAGALRVYESLRRLLRTELGADPGPETRTLHHRLLMLAATDEISPAPPLPRARSPRPSRPAPP